MNHTQKAGVMNSDRNQEASSTMVTTCASERVNSPAPPSANAIGTKNRMVVSDEVSSGIARVRPDSIAAAIRSAPDSRRTRMSSAMTMPLSTSMPSAMISAAIDTRCSSTSNARMTMIASSIVTGTKAPTISPVRTPRNNMTTASTMPSVCSRLLVAPAIVDAINSGW